MMRALPLNFRGTNTWDKEKVLSRFVADGARAVVTDNSGIIVILEERNKNGGYRLDLLDRIAAVINDTKSIKKKQITKDEADTMVSVLKEQSKKLETMAATYKLLAAALSGSRDNFVEISKNDEHIKKILDNPFE